jgi:hypothetical protein
VVISTIPDRESLRRFELPNQIKFPIGNKSIRLSQKPLIMRRYERASTLLTSNRPVDDWGKLLGDTAAVTALLDRLLHHAHVLKCGPRSWRTKVQTDLRTHEGTKQNSLVSVDPEIAGFALSRNCRFSTVHRGLERLCTIA